MSADATVTVSISHDSDVAIARTEARAMARSAGLGNVDVEAFVTAVSEIARNIVNHAVLGRIVFGVLAAPRAGVFALATDGGPGIPDVSQAMQDGYSTTGSMGAGLGGATRLVDSLEITSSPSGTIVRLEKWLR